MMTIKLLEIIMMTTMSFLTLPYDCVTISFLPEILWFGGPTYPTFLYDVTLFSLFLLKASQRGKIWYLDFLLLALVK